MSSPGPRASRRDTGSVTTAAPEGRVQLAQSSLPRPTSQIPKLLEICP